MNEQAGDSSGSGGAAVGKWFRLAGAMALVGMVSAAGCALSRSGGMQQNCTAPGDCDDANPGTVGGCDQDGFCLYTNEPDGVLPDQVAGDCGRVECQGGVVVTVPDDTDRPANEPCKTYS